MELSNRKLPFRNMHAPLGAVVRGGCAQRAGRPALLQVSQDPRGPVVAVQRPEPEHRVAGEHQARQLGDHRVTVDVFDGAVVERAAVGGERNRRADRIASRGTDQHVARQTPAVAQHDGARLEPLHLAAGLLGALAQRGHLLLVEPAVDGTSCRHRAVAPGTAAGRRAATRRTRSGSSGDSAPARGPRSRATDRRATTGGCAACPSSPCRTTGTRHAPHQPREAAAALHHRQCQGPWRTCCRRAAPHGGRRARTGRSCRPSPSLACSTSPPKTSRPGRSGRRGVLNCVETTRSASAWNVSSVSRFRTVSRVVWLVVGRQAIRN